ncbi:MAG: LysR family transcriptional regulator [Pseudomonadota bacterium]
MRARQLEVFIAIMKAGTVTGASQILNISQPALSQVLKRTEDEIGFLLFSRERGRLQPTPEAIELYPDALRIFDGLEGLRRKTEDFKDGQTGMVRIGSSVPPSMSVLPKALADFRHDHPDIQLRAHVAPLDALIAMLRAGDVNIALGFEDRVPPDITAERIAETRFCCLVPDTEDFADMTSLTFSYLQQHTLISYRSGTRARRELERAASLQGNTFRPDLEIDSAISAVGFVQAGLGVAVVDALLPWSQFQALTTRRLSNSPTLPLAMLTMQERVLSQADLKLMDALRSACDRAGL